MADITDLPPSGPGIRRRRPRGWTFDLGVPDLLAPYASASALEAYRALGAPVGAGERSGPGGSIGLLHFAGLGATEAAILLERLPPGDLLDRQNFSPTLGAFLRSAVAYPGEVELHGYCVGPDREDERVSVEGVLLYAHPELIIAQETPWREAPHPASCQCAELWRIAQHDYGLADAECPPDEYGRFRSRRRPDEHCWRLWWD